MNRRQSKAYKLRVYLDQIKAVEAMTQEQWLESYTTAPQDMQYMPKGMWLAYLKECALVESRSLVGDSHAA